MRDYAATPSANGLSWATAFDNLEIAILAAKANPGNDLIRVAAPGSAWKPGAPAIGAWGAIPKSNSTFLLDDPQDSQISLVGGYAFDGSGALEHDQPFECPVDLTFDGQIDGADMAVLLGAWSPTCGPQGAGNYLACDLVDRDANGLPNPCFCADFNRDGKVEGADLSILLGAWGLCPGCPNPPCGTNAAAMMEGGESAVEAVSFVTPIELAVMYGFESLEGFVAWLTSLPSNVRDEILALLMPWPNGGESEEGN